MTHQIEVKIDRFQNRLVACELQAASELWRHWAWQRAQNKNLGTSQERLQLFRKYILGSIYGLHREALPHEITADEYQLCLDAVTQARDKCGKQTTPACLKAFEVRHEVDSVDGETVEVLTPFPAPPTHNVKKVVCDYSEYLRKAIPKRYGSTIRTRELAFEIVGHRLGIGPGTVDAHRRSKSRYKKQTKKGWSLLATLFLELNFYGETEKQARALDCLLGSGYSLFKLYYLVQISHSITWQMSLGKWKKEMIDRLCTAICPEKTEGPFMKVFQASQGSAKHDHG